jgi:hypothetical protein
MSGDVPPATEDRLRAICARLPDAYEEPAWIGVRWRIRTKTFAHACAVEPGSPTSDAIRIFAPQEPLTVVTFRVPHDDLAGLAAAGFPFYRLSWGTNVMGLVLTPDTDWTEVAELLTDSYRVQAPKKLARLIDGR